MPKYHVQYEIEDSEIVIKVEDKLVQRVALPSREHAELVMQRIVKKAKQDGTLSENPS